MMRFWILVSALCAVAGAAAAADEGKVTLLPGDLDVPVLAGTPASCDEVIAPSDLVRWHEPSCVAVSPEAMVIGAAAYRDWVAAHGWMPVGEFLGGEWLERPDGKGRCDKVVVVPHAWKPTAMISLWRTENFYCDRKAGQ